MAAHSQEAITVVAYIYINTAEYLKNFSIFIVSIDGFCVTFAYFCTADTWQRLYPHNNPVPLWKTVCSRFCFSIALTPFSIQCILICVRVSPWSDKNVFSTLKNYSTIALYFFRIQNAKCLLDTFIRFIFVFTLFRFQCFQCFFDHFTFRFELI